MYFGSYSLFLGTFNKFVIAYQKIIVFTVIVIIKDYITISPLQKKKKKTAWTELTLQPTHDQWGDV